MWVAFGILGLFLWILLAFWPASIAASKGRSFILYFIISLFFWWITLFVVYAMDDQSNTAQPA
jgi:hypothetical protein